MGENVARMGVVDLMGVIIQHQFGLRFNAPLGAAMAFTVIAICVIIIGTLGLTLRQSLKARA